MTKHIIAWDLGATKCTAGLLTLTDNARSIICHQTHYLKLSETQSLEDMITQFDKNLDIPVSQADAVCIGAAGYYNGETIHHENPYPYPMRIKAIAEKQQWKNYQVIHDYAAIVCATFSSFIQNKNNIHVLRQGEFDPQGRRVALGVGTGLGLKDGVLFEDGHFWFGENEMGHIGISVPPQATQEDFIRHQFLMNFFEYEYTSLPITFENILSGQGLIRLYRFLHPEVKTITAETIGDMLQAGNEPELADLIAWYLGLFIGTVQLCFMPQGGIYITGGITLKHSRLLALNSFERGIQATPAYASKRKSYSLSLLTNEQAPLYGCAYYAAHQQLGMNGTIAQVA